MTPDSPIPGLNLPDLDTLSADQLAQLHNTFGALQRVVSALYASKQPKNHDRIDELEKIAAGLWTANRYTSIMGALPYTLRASAQQRQPDEDRPSPRP